jgi:hypothetical protein
MLSNGVRRPPRLLIKFRAASRSLGTPEKSGWSHKVKKLSNQSKAIVSWQTDSLHLGRTCLRASLQPSAADSPNS